MFPAVYTTLKAASAVTDIVGSAPARVYEHADAPQDTTKPYITWFAVTGTPENTLSELPATDRVVIQIDCWHQTATGIKALAVAVRDAIEPYAHMTGMPANLREPETKLYRIALQFDWYVGR